MNEHIADLAELYALGALGERDADRVNAHAGTCPACSRVLGDAERTIATLASMTAPQIEAPPELASRLRASARAPRPRYAAFGAIAAAFAVVVGGATATREMLRLQAIAAQDDAALAIVATSHFKHATLTKLDPAAPTAKALWGASKDWVYVIVGAPSCACTVVVFTANGERDLGVPIERASTSATFARGLHQIRGVELRRNGVAFERTTLP